MRALAAEHGVSVHVFSKMAEEDSAIDRSIDERSEQVGATYDRFVLDARLAWHFVPDSFKVFLDVDPEVAARRILGDDRSSEIENTDFEQTKRNTQARATSEAKRYAMYYGVDYGNSANYDLVIDTSDLSVDDVVNAIVSALERRE